MTNISSIIRDTTDSLFQVPFLKKKLIELNNDYNFQTIFRNNIPSLNNT